eukprot:TRINITY_DN1951_c0_g1_i2.p1 TRINITY_DN1951_c0_g1~~TRINITY_DN1951_c0_g1_i2.p1  ORF type:complete len:661 (-),score=99.18 TRINITY_DN1951_c0_g1_i2:38-2020(-)
MLLTTGDMKLLTIETDGNILVFDPNTLTQLYNTSHSAFQLPPIYNRYLSTESGKYVQNTVNETGIYRQIIGDTVSGYGAISDWFNNEAARIYYEWLYTFQYTETGITLDVLNMTNLFPNLENYVSSIHQIDEMNKIMVYIRDQNTVHFFQYGTQVEASLNFSVHLEGGISCEYNYFVEHEPDTALLMMNKELGYLIIRQKCSENYYSEGARQLVVIDYNNILDLRFFIINTTHSLNRNYFYGDNAIATSYGFIVQTSSDDAYYIGEVYLNGSSSYYVEQFSESNSNAEHGTTICGNENGIYCWYNDFGVMHHYPPLYEANVFDVLNTNEDVVYKSNLRIQQNTDFVASNLSLFSVDGYILVFEESSLKLSNVDQIYCKDLITRSGSTLQLTGEMIIVKKIIAHKNNTINIQPNTEAQLDTINISDTQLHIENGRINISDAILNQTSIRASNTTIQVSYVDISTSLITLLDTKLETDTELTIDNKHKSDEYTITMDSLSIIQSNQSIVIYNGTLTIDATNEFPSINNTYERTFLQAGGEIKGNFDEVRVITAPNKDGCSKTIAKSKYTKSSFSIVFSRDVEACRSETIYDDTVEKRHTEPISTGDVSQTVKIVITVAITVVILILMTIAFYFGYTNYNVKTMKKLRDASIEMDGEKRSRED